MSNLSNMPWEDRPVGSKEVVWRYSANPIIPRDLLPTSNSIFNSAVVPFGDSYAGVFRCDDTNRRMRLHVGFSKDAVHWDIHPEPLTFECDNAEVGEWVYGYLADEDYINDINSIDLSSKQVNPETIGQFSLFYDKNGKEIYEDDILKFYHNNKEFVCVVGWNNKVGAWCIRLKYEAILGIRPLGEWLCDYLMEKNGNIHDNPELLEGGSDEE